MGENENGGISTFAARLGVGLVQGVALYLLLTAFDNKTWPATDGFVYAPFLFVSLFVPLLVSVSIGDLRTTTLALWSLIAAALAAGAAWYAIWQWPIEGAGVDRFPRIAPDFPVFFFTLVGLYIAHTLIAAADGDRRLFPRYTTCFDLAWKLLLQGILSACFVGVFWGVLELGAALFNMIGLSAFRTFIEHRWFAVPVTTLAAAAALHVTDVRAGLVRGLRSLGLALLSWLLPLMAGLAAAFLVSLFFTGLKPLWDTRFAAGDLLIASAVLVILINAAFQDGSEEHRPVGVLRVAGSLAAVLLVPLAALSAYAIWLRVMQYGWTTERVSSVGCLLVAGFIAIGYAAAAIPSGNWLSRIARWNIYSAALGLVVIVSLFSPIADPMRVAVDSQMARLAGGSVGARQFDFGYLRWRSGRFGLDALHKLERWTGPDADYIRAKAAAELKPQERAYNVVVAQDVASNFSVYPLGRKLPSDFLRQDWQHSSDVSALPSCMTTTGVGCTAFFLDLAGDGHEEIVVIGVNNANVVTGSNAVFARGARGEWRFAGTPDGRWQCPSVLAALRRGDVHFVAPAPAWRDIEVQGTRLTVNRMVEEPPCPN